MKFRCIFIANLTEYARPLVEQMDNEIQKRQELNEDFGLCDRFLISDKDDRVLITPWLIDKDFLSDTCKVFDFKNILNLSPEKPTISLCEDILREKELRELLIKIIKRNPSEIYSYVGSDEFLKIVEYFKEQGLKFKTPEAPKIPGLVKFFGSKSGFREVLSHETSMAKLKMPEGYVASNKKEILYWANYFYQKKKNFVIKANYGLAGAGSEIVDVKKMKKNDFNRTMEKLINKNNLWLKDKTVIEEFIEADFETCGGAPSVEFSVSDGGIRYLYSCGMRIIKGNIFRGSELGKEAIPQWIEEKMITYGYRFAKVLQKAGYRGYFDKDFINTKDKKLYALEANIRRTGVTHVYEAGLRLLGKDFLKRYYLTHNNLYENKRVENLTYQNLKNKINPLLFPINGKKEGIILTMVSLLPQSKFGYIAVGRNKEKVKEMENKMSHIIA